MDHDTSNSPGKAGWREKLGLEIAFELVDWDHLVERFMQKQPPQMFVVTWIADYPEPDSLLCRGPAQLLIQWQDELFDGLTVEARSALEQEKRLQLFQQMDRMLVEEAVIVPLSYSRTHLLIKPWVKLLPSSCLSSWYWKDVVIEPH